MGVAVECELTCNTGRERCIYGSRVLREVCDDEFTLLLGSPFCEIGSLCEQVVEFGDEVLHGRNELNETFGDEDSTEVVAVFSTFCNDVGYIVYNILKSLVLSFNFFRNDADVGLSLECAFKSDVGS